MVKDGWYICPQCKKKKLFKILPKTKLINFPVYCKLCEYKGIINIEPEPRARAD